MTRVLILSHTTGYQLRAFNDAAEALGIELVFATDRCHKLDDPWQDRAIPVRFHDPDASVDAIVERAREYPVQGLIAVGDRPLVLAARAARALDLPWHSVEGAAASTDKRRSRAILAAAGLPSPRFAMRDARCAMSDAGLAIRDSGLAIRDSGLAIRDSGLAIRDSGSAIRDSGFDGLSFPCVLKPLGLSGSRGVIRANDRGEFVAAFERIRALLARPAVRAARAGLEDQILVEDYIDGREFALEGVSTDGVLQVFALFDKPDPLEGPFFEETIYVTPSRLPPTVQARIVEHVQRATRALGLRHGPIHAECRVTSDGTVFVLEVAGRPIGGRCSSVLTLVRPGGPGQGPGSDRGQTRPGVAGGKGEGAALSLEEVLLLHALGAPIADVTREEEAAAVMMVPIPRRGMYKGVDGEAGARAVAGVTDVRITAKAGQLLEPLPEAGSYLGFIFARGTTPEEAHASVRAAHTALTFDIAREVPLTAHGLL